VAPKLHGDVLSIYEESDSLGRSCQKIFAQSPDLGRSGEIRLQTGLKHGFIYRPLAQWMGPVVGWAKTPQQTFAPTPRACHSAAATSSGIVIWGGARACGVDVTSDSLMWTWNGAIWDSRAGPPIPPREDALLVADPGSDSLWLYGGRRDGVVHSDLWLFDGRVWRLLIANGAPGALEHAAAAFDRDQRHLVIFGGAIGQATSGRTWEWNGITWLAFESRGPAPRVGHGMAWSEIDNAVVAYGGFGAEQYRDLWRWDGGSWSLLSSEGPTLTEGHVLAESERGISVAGPGLTEGAPLRVWDWDGKTFHQREGDGPAVRVGATATFDARRNALMYWGGSVSGRPVEGNPVEFRARR
jgi:hypothetical protein